MLYGLLVDLVPVTREFYDEKMWQWWNNESRLWATMGENQPISKAEIARSTERRAERHRGGYKGVHFLMKAKDGTAIGTIGLNRVDQWNRYSWVGAWIGEEDYWSGGHGTDALLLLVEYAFEWLDLRRLILMTMGINLRAQHNVTKCGFKLEYHARENTVFNGLVVDSVQYGLLRAEWLGREVLVDQLSLREKAQERYSAVAPPDMAKQ